MGDALPGEELIEKGVADLSAGAETAEALLVSIGAQRLRAVGVGVGTALENAEHRLYELLRAEGADAAHGRYNALVRRLVAYERAAETLAAVDARAR